MRLRTARARLLVSRGEVAPALEEARAAVERAALLDDVNLSADAYAALAFVLEASGRADEASAARDEAHGRYVLKGNVVAADGNRGVAPRVTTVAAASYRQRPGDPTEEEVGVWPRDGIRGESHGARATETITADSTVRSRTRCGGLRRRTARRTDRSS